MSIVLFKNSIYSFHIFVKVLILEQTLFNFLIFGGNLDFLQKMFYNINYCGQSYKHFTLVIYNSRVVIWGIFQSGMTLES